MSQKEILEADKIDKVTENLNKENVINVESQRFMGLLKAELR